MLLTKRCAVLLVHQNGTGRPTARHIRCWEHILVSPDKETTIWRRSNTLLGANREHISIVAFPGSACPARACLS